MAKAGMPVARLVPVQKEKIVRKPGALKGKMRIADDLDGPLPDELRTAFAWDRSRETPR